MNRSRDIDLDSLDMVPGITDPEAWIETQKSARAVIIANAKDADEAQTFLEMLGLDDE